MPNQPKRQNKITLIQIVAALVFLVMITLIQNWSRGNQPGEAPPVTITPVRILTDTPVGPAGEPPTVTAVAQPPAPNLPPLDSLSKFDYFLLALSWSPDYCASNGSNDPQQCSIGRKLGFVLHGLWPQNNRGYPSNCTREKMPEDVKAQFPGLYPNDALFDHEWEKHGTCTGLSTTDYLLLSKGLKESVVIPDAYRSPEQPFRSTVQKLTEDFTTANPAYPATAFAVNCSSNGRYLKELYVCFSKDGQPAACSTEVQKNAQRTCQSPDFLVRNTR